MGGSPKEALGLHPPELDAEIEAAAAEDGMTYSAWLASTARKELTIRAGLEAVAEFERQHGAFSADERADAGPWAQQTLESGRRSTARRRRSA